MYGFRACSFFWIGVRLVLMKQYELVCTGSAQEVFDTPNR